MTTMQTLELLSRIQTALHNALDEVDDIQDNDVAKEQAIKYLMEVEGNLFHVIDVLEEKVITEGLKSGAV